MYRECPHEEAVCKAALTGDWQELSTAHISQCVLCSEVAEAVARMGKLSQEYQGQVLPDPQLIWFEAQLFKRQLLRERSLQPVILAEALAPALLALIPASFITWYPEIREFLSQLLV